MILPYPQRLFNRGTKRAPIPPRSKRKEPRKAALKTGIYAAYSFLQIAPFTVTQSSPNSSFEKPPILPKVFFSMR